ncbi:hypothetical protein ACTXT7_014335 [Hymenolepis weldensis]
MDVGNRTSPIPRPRKQVAFFHCKKVSEIVQQEFQGERVEKVERAISYSYHYPIFSRIHTEKVKNNRSSDRVEYFPLRVSKENQHIWIEEYILVAVGFSFYLEILFPKSTPRI